MAGSASPARLFVGHPDAGDRAAVIYSLIISCQRHGHDPHAYLRDVLARWRPFLRPGGCFFIGDVRNHALDTVFHGSVALFQGGGQGRVGEWRDALQARLDRDSELTLAPAFFAALAGSLPGVSSVTCLAKRAQAGNEMTRFRYEIGRAHV